jgi:uncharacterized protein (TIGR02271 family)
MALNSTIPVGENRRAIGSFPDRRSAEQAIHELQDSGFSMDRVSIVAKDDDRDQIAGAEVTDRTDNKADEGAKVGAVSGGTLGGLTGLLVGLGTLAIPGVGPIMLAGAAATALATTAAGGAIGAATGGLLGGLVGLGIPEDRARAYNDRVSAGEYLVMVDGSAAEISRAEAILSHRGIQDWGIYDVPVVDGVDSALPMTGMPAAGTAAMMSTPAPMDAAPASLSADREVTQPLEAPVGDTVKLYEERLVVDKDRAKTGEVAIGKRVETEIVQASVGLDKERVVVERTTPGSEAAVLPGDRPFQAGEVIRMEVYEETPEIRKEAFVREELSIRKEVIASTVNAEETLRREELEVKTEGNPVLNTDSGLRTDDQR